MTEDPRAELMARSKNLRMKLHCYEKALMGEGSQTLLEATAL